MSSHSDKDIQFHADIATVYDYLTLDPRKFLTNILFKKIDKQIKSSNLMIDLGCGTGQMLCRYKQLFNNQIGVDHSGEMLEQAREKPELSSEKTVLIHSDIDKFLGEYTGPQPNFVTIVGFLHHLQKQELTAILKKIHTILVQGGQILIAEPILSVSVPKLVSKINENSILVERLKTSMPDHAEHPDEEPLDEQDLIKSIEEAGFSRKSTTKGYEIFHLNYPPPIWEKAFFRLLSLYYGTKKGNVIAILAEK